MTWPPRCPYRISVASYVLGALPADERRELDTHLRTCQECRTELIGLAALPGLLARLRRRFRRATGLSG
ncbi:MAG: zf-HC2 domain-containing protein [Micromonosporaceae bacterium]|jgi:anti-sigma factor RsiW|nr:zf-HC2 domain-containing protein [Micromonosporaceae bacterium]